MGRKTRRKSRKTGNKGRNASARKSGVGRSRRFEREFNPDYSYVIKDLRRIGLLAGTFFIILIALSFFLR